MKLRRLLSVLGVLALMGVWMNHSAGISHADNTLSLTNTTLQYTDGPFVYPNVTDQVGNPDCTVPKSCDDYPLTVNVPAGTDATQQIKICFSYDQSTDPEVDFDIWVYDSNGNVITKNVNPTPPNECVTIPAISGNYIVRADPWFPGGESYTGTISLVPKPLASSAPPPDAATRSTGINPRYQDYLAPMSLGGNTAGEPSIGFDPKTGAVMTSSDLQTLKTTFDDSTSPAKASWSDISAFTSKDSLDPILFTDRTGRTFVSQLTGQDSLTSFTDDDGATYTPSQGGGIPSGVDHQTIGGGSYAGVPPVTATYPDAIYYCSQDIATAFCARSDNGGQTFGAGIPIYNDTQCAGIHGHVKVAPNGTVYVPARSCNGNQAVAVSTDNGMTWTLRPVPDSTPAIGNDPSIGIATDGTVYFGYQGADGHARIAVSHDQGQTWSKSADVGYLAGVQNSVFPAVVAGDPSRAAFSYLGTTTGGDFQSQPKFDGIWYLFTSSTYDGGKTWTTVQDTPDPVQRGSICISGTTCSNTPDDRNLLDFIDSTIDARGRVLVAYADGCIQQCVNGLGSYDSTNNGQSQQSQLNYFTQINGIARQSGGRSLFAKFDPKEPTVPARPTLTATQPAPGAPVTLTWQAPDNGGSPIATYQILRGTKAGKESSYAAVIGTHLSLTDTHVSAKQTYYYKLVAVNKYGKSLPSPEVSPVFGQPPTKPAVCSLPGEQTIGDLPGDQTGGILTPDLDLLGVYVAQPASAPADLVFSLKIPAGSAPGPNRQWRIFWDADNQGNRWYAGMDTDATGAASFVYGHNTGQNTGVKYAPAIPDTTIPADAGSNYDPATGTITIYVPRSGVGAPPDGKTLTDLQARSFGGQGDVTTVESTAAVDSTGWGAYMIFPAGYCSS